MSKKAKRKKGRTHSLREKERYRILKVPVFASKLNTLNWEKFLGEFQRLWVDSQCHRHRQGVEGGREREKGEFFFKIFVWGRFFFKILKN